jgi:RNA polymerase sigma-70 factor (sigma-E family)
VPRGQSTGESVTSATGDDGQDFEVFFTRYQRDLARLGYVLTGDHAAADDVVADALIAAWQHWDRVCATDSPIAYVRRMVINMAASRVRSRVRERRGLLALLPGIEHLASVADSAAVIDVRVALKDLPPGRRACIVLRYAFDLSEAEVAETLQISVGTVKSQTSKAATQLRYALTQLGTDGAVETEVEDAGYGRGHRR